MKLLLLTRATFVAIATVALLSACGDDNDPVDPGTQTVQRTFTYVRPNSAPAVTSVNLAGSFNNWSTSAQAMTKQADGSWKATIPLTRGTYQYKFVMNGSQWPSNMCNDPTWGDPNNGGKVDATVTTCADDNNGGQNAVLTIQ